MTSRVFFKRQFESANSSIGFKNERFNFVPSSYNSSKQYLKRNEVKTFELRNEVKTFELRHESDNRSRMQAGIAFHEWIAEEIVRKSDAFQEVKCN